MESISEEELFQIKQKFLQHIPHPKLIRKQLRLLSRFVNKETKPEQNKLPLDMELGDYLNQYTALLLQLKLKIANTRNAEPLFSYLNELLNLHERYIQKLLTYLPDCDYDESSIKQSDPFDAHTLSTELKANTLSDNEIMPYLCKQFSGCTANDYSELGKAVIRAKKILENVG
ncbi:MAG: hypothetical protein WDZ35_06970 [Crocinitomicaceae bacterium]